MPEAVRTVLAFGFERLRAAGKCPKVVVVAVMRKLLELAWTLLRSGQPFSLSQGTRASTP